MSQIQNKERTVGDFLFDATEKLLDELRKPDQQDIDRFNENQENAKKEQEFESEVESDGIAEHKRGEDATD